MPARYCLLIEDKGATEHAGNMSPAKPLGVCDVTQSPSLATDDHAEPFEITRCSRRPDGTLRAMCLWRQQRAL